ncbi:YqaE/Pmp3 family membrane protein [Hymenobacter metallicola]|uniref:YqaE/Pmp3 family membrane protein n=1 Tax=Hymenobacter metallicola TaxID=2563114 RepID=A0A4Z0QHG1_9BACT|nr:YqaE/Pmp3 family membrane protein [Hymenobacter metallicola]TGE29450.1 YqaE/Pmp3 family membrane protein [Hymenobacter metallicola]
MLLAILLPGLSMILNGHLLKGIICFILQITLIGWLPAAIWGVASRNNDLNERRHREMMAAMKTGASR